MNFNLVQPKFLQPFGQKSLFCGLLWLEEPSIQIQGLEVPVRILIETVESEDYSAWAGTKFKPTD